MDESTIQPVIYQCTNPECGFRFPVPRAESANPPCPRCKSPTHLVPYPPEVQRESMGLKKPTGRPLEALLDNIRSTFNVGAMFRTADGAGLNQLHLSGITPSPTNTKISKTALGAEYAIQWNYSRNGREKAEQLVREGKRLIALETSRNPIPIFDYVLPDDNRTSVLVVGNEVSGIDPGILDLCDQSLWIPMSGYKRSLNVAIAFGIAVYALRYSIHSNIVDEIYS